MLEMKALPTVTFCTVPFKGLATVRRASLGLPDLPLIFLPHPMMTKTPAEVEQLADGVVAEVVQYLTGQAAPQAAEGAR